MNFKTHQGFTLIELLVTVSIVAILIGIVAPSFSTLIQTNRQSEQLNNLIASIHMARAEASTLRSTVTMCASTNGNDCNTANWENGWIIFADANNDAAFDVADGDNLIRFQDQLAGGNTLRETGFNFAANGVIMFATNGFLSGTNPAPGTLTLCDDRGLADARAIIVNISGTSRAATDEDDSGTPDNHNGGGNDIACP